MALLQLRRYEGIYYATSIMRCDDSRFETRLGATLIRGANAGRPLPDVASNLAATSTRDMPQGPKAPIADPAGVSNMTAEQHKSALQALSNGQPVPYPATLRTVVHAGTKAPKREDQDPDKKPPGYSRNARGGFFTS